MNEFRISHSEGKFSLSSELSRASFAGYSEEEVLKQFQNPIYSDHQTSVSPYGHGELSVFVPVDSLRIRPVESLTFLPVAIYIALMVVYAVLFYPPALVYAQGSLISFYLEVLGTTTFLQSQTFSISYALALALWVLIAGVFTVGLAIPLFVVMGRSLSFVPSLVYRFLYYKVLGLFVQTSGESGDRH